jgi:hypothetical protein
MKAYVGSKIIKAEPQDHPKTGEEGYAVEYPDGYRSWSPKRVFEAAYRLVEPAEVALLNELA